MSGLPRSPRRSLGSLCSPGPVSTPESCSLCLRPGPSDQITWVRFSSPPPPLDVPSLLSYGLHSKEQKKGFPEINEVALLRPHHRQVSEPLYRLHVRPFVLPRGGTIMASSDFWESLKIPRGILCTMTDFQTSPGKNSRLPPHPPHLLHPRLMATGFACHVSPPQGYNP